MSRKNLLDWAPLACVIVVLWLMVAMSGCAVSMQLQTDAQHSGRTKDRVLIDRAHGSYQGDRAITLDQYRERYRLANDPQTGS